MTAYLKGRTRHFIILSTVFVFLSASCRKSDPGNIGADFIGVNNGYDVTVNDTTKLILFSSQQDAFSTKYFRYHLLGDMNDPVFGKSKANIYAQFSPPGNQFSLLGGTIDSVVLRLRPLSCCDYYGNVSTQQVINVYELQEQLSASPDSLYNSNRAYRISAPGSSVLPAPIGTYRGKFNLTDSVRETVQGNTTTFAPHTRITLSNAFVSKLQRAEAAGAFVSATAFQNYIYGLAIMATTDEGLLTAGEGAIVNFTLGTSPSGVSIYYHNGTGSQRSDFPFAISDIKTNQFSHNTTLPVVSSTSTTHFNQTYVQSMQGIKTRILLPNLAYFARKEPVAVIGAELVLTADENHLNEPGYSLPPRLLLQAADSAGVLTILDDFLEIPPFSPKEYYGGIYNGQTHEYRFNIVRYVQRILNSYKNSGQDVNYGLNVIIPPEYIVDRIPYYTNMNRLVLNTNTGMKKVKLILSYTVIK